MSRLRARGGLTRIALAVAAGLALLLAAGDAAPVLAHANLESSTPAANSVLQAAPAEVYIKFTEQIEPKLTEIRVIGVNGKRVDNGIMRFDPSDTAVAAVGLGTLSDGSYTVSWANVSAIDGHAVRGSYLFSIGVATLVSPIESAETPRLQSPLEPAVRWVGLLGALGTFGGIALRLVLERVGVNARKLAAEHSEEQARGASAALEAARLRSGQALWFALALALAGALAYAWVAASTTYRSGLLSVRPGDLTSLIFDTTWGRVLAFRVGLLALTGLQLGAAARALRAAGARDNSAPAAWGDSARRPSLRLAYEGNTFLAAAWAGGAVACFSLASHGAATTGLGAAGLANDLLHVFAAAIWVGGLLQLAAILPGLLRRASAGDGPRLVASLIPWFSLMAGLSAGVLLVTGIFAGYQQVTAPSAIVTPYGLALVAKLALVAPLVGLAAVNLLRIRPRLSGSDGARKWLRHFVIGEAMLGATILLAVGFMTSMEPARLARSRELANAPGIDFSATVEGTQAAVSLQPGTVGDNSIVVFIRDRGGRPIENATAVTGRMRYLGQELGEPYTEAYDHGGGYWIVHNTQVGIAGPWEIDLRVQRPDAFDANFRWPINVSATRAQRSALTPDLTVGRLLFGVEIALIGLLFAGAAVPMGGWWSATGRALSGIGAAAVIAGALLVYQSGAPGPHGVAGQVNPIPPDQMSVETGRRLYIANCLTCHGATGRGDGPGAAGLDPPPLDLTVHVPLHPQKDLFFFIRYGMPGTAMPAWGERGLTGDDIWNIVNYLETLPPASGTAQGTPESAG